MTSEVGIVNIGLSIIGEEPVIALDGSSKAARVGELRFDGVRDSLLRAHFWNFAKKRATLAKDAVAPAFGFNNAFTLPSDFLRVVLVNDGTDKYTMEQQAGVRVLLSDESAINLSYIARVDDPNLFDAQFTEALGAALAVEFAPPLTANETRLQLAIKEFDRKIDDARATNSMEEPSPEFIQEDFVQARLGTGSFRPIGEAS